MNAPIMSPPLTAEQWIEREIASLKLLRARLGRMTERERAAAAERYEEAALNCATHIFDDDPPQTRQSLIMLAGRHAFKGKVYRSAA